jgi:hypothetical protein
MQNRPSPFAAQSDVSNLGLPSFDANCRTTNTNAYAPSGVKGCANDWPTARSGLSLADLRSHYYDPSEVATPTVTCSQSRAAYFADGSDSDDSTIRSRNECAPTSAQSALDPRASYSTPALDWVNRQFDNDDPFARSAPSIVSRYDHESVDCMRRVTIADFPRDRKSAANRGDLYSGLDDLAEDVFSKSEPGTSANSERTAYRGGSSQW